MMMNVTEALGFAESGIKALEAIAHAKIDQRDAEIARLRQTLKIIASERTLSGDWAADLAVKTLAGDL